VLELARRRWLPAMRSRTAVGSRVRHPDSDGVRLQEFYWRLPA